MADYCFAIDFTDISSNECFREASAGELRVLLVLAEYNKRGISLDTLSELAGVSAARAKSAISLFEAAGVINEVTGYAVVKDEFDECEIKDRAVIVAREIRDEGLAELIEECARLMDRDSLSTEDVKIITSLATETTLTPEYILALSAFLKSTLAEGKKLTAKKLRAEAEKLIAKDIDTLEGLEAYIKDKSEQMADEWEYRRIMQMWSRPFSTAERDYIKKWAHVYCFSTAIVSMAYEKSVLNTHGVSFPYMDAMLTDWYNAGCKTLAECKARAEQTSAAIKTEKERKQKSSNRNAESEIPKYSNFNAEDAMLRAIERSYGKSGD